MERIVQGASLIIRSFPPIINKKSKVLVLGSMPGEASLKANEYYAHPKNQFWILMARLLKYNLPLSYVQKKRMLLDNKIALWDVIYSCKRKGSLDSKITDIVLNDLDEIFKKYKTIEAIFLNGKKAYHTFIKRYSHLKVSVFDLPSTSPAYTKSMFWKLKRWQVIKKYLTS